MSIDRIIHPIGAACKDRLLRARARYIAKLDWRRRHAKVFALHPEYRRPAPRDVEREHRRIWRPLRRDFRLDTLRVCYNTSGVADSRIVPEEVFASEIQFALNRDLLSVFLQRKGFFNRWMPGGVFPRDHLHNADGVWLNGRYEPIDAHEADDLVDGLPYPVVFKPSTGRGGTDVHIVADAATLRELMADRRGFIVQEKIEPHEFFRRFNDYALNTLRVCTYRSVATEQTHYLNAALRVGRTGKVDNLKQGGVAVPISADGTLHDYAIDLYGAKFTEHPDSGVGLGAGEQIPSFEALKELVTGAARRVLRVRLASFDCCLDVDGRWRLVELNLGSQTIRMAQASGRPFFGPFTDEVIDYCRRNPRYQLV